MIEGAVIVNDGTREAHACIKWIKLVASDMPIRSVCLSNDPFVDIDEVNRICQEEGILNYVIEFPSYLISSTNQNVKKAWDFERQLKGLQHQKSILMNMKDGEVAYTYFVSPLRGGEYNDKILEIVDRIQRANIKPVMIAQEGKAMTHTEKARPLEKVITDEDFENFLIENNIQL